jgi:beta-phosphoglucomutase-like phosphatase (HAD superfamily)
VDSDGLHDEAERLARAHPDYGLGKPETHTSDWMPQHAVPKHKARPPMSRIDLEYIERRVQADIDRMDRELDLIPTMDDLERTLLELDRYRRDRDVALLDMASRMHRAMEKTARLTSMYSAGTPSWVGYDMGAPKPAKQRKPKTYVTPGRKQGKTWIARLNQSKEARNAHKGN